MPFIVRSYNKKMNTTYCYECENYKDPDTGEWKSHRKLMGKLDASGNIIPTVESRTLFEPVLLPFLQNM